MTASKRRKILAIDPTTYGFAFVMFENRLVLDWGQRYTRRRNVKVYDAFHDLLDYLGPDVVVLEDSGATQCRRSQTVRRELEGLAACARRQNVEVVRIARADVRNAWVRRGVTTKEAIAARMSEEWPELAPFTPPRRKISQTEDGRVNLFDAASLALHSFDRFVR